MLVDLLRLPAEPTPEPSITWLMINYSQAWVRWYCPNHHDLLRMVQQLAKAKRAGEETLENLFQWVGHEGFRNA